MSNKIGILGGGQLGRMFLQAAYDYPFEYHVMDPSENAPCAGMCQHFVQGDFNEYDDVVRFGKDLDVISIEIEHVNTAALQTLTEQGKTVIPTVSVLQTLQDKGLQKQFYAQHNIHTPDYYLIDNRDELDTGRIDYPFVQKLRTGGYDGKGVQVIRSSEDLDLLWDAPSVIEMFTDIEKEVAVMVARDQLGNTAAYPCVEMVFDPELNLVDYLFAPANIDGAKQQQASDLATSVVDALDSAGIFAIELFLDREGQLWVNETAPRVHNSGHHTIEAAYTSQFEQMLRVLAGLSLGNTALRESAAMMNLIGAPDHIGAAVIQGLETLSSFDKTALHWYGKSNTSPGRKMGHVTMMGDASEISEKVAAIKSSVAVISQSD